MAVAAANASRPAITSFGLRRKIRITSPRSSSIAAAAAPRRRRGGLSSSSEAARLGTFLYLVGLVLEYRSHRGHQGRDLVGRLRYFGPHEGQRQCHGDGGS